MSGLIGKKLERIDDGLILLIMDKVRDLRPAVTGSVTVDAYVCVDEDNNFVNVIAEDLPKKYILTEKDLYKG